MRPRIADLGSAVDEVTVGVVKLDGNSDYAGPHILDPHQLARHGVVTAPDLDLHLDRGIADEEDALLRDVLTRADDRLAIDTNRDRTVKADPLGTARVIWVLLVCVAHVGSITCIDRHRSRPEPAVPRHYPPRVQESRYDREPGYAERYRDRRFQTGTGSRTDARERKAIVSLLRNTPVPEGPWLDVPCGAGRLSLEVPGPAVLVDRDPNMVAAARDHGLRACASVHALPFGDDAFAGALCMRLLQHIATPVERINILRELARVSRGPIVVSFFDSCSLQHLRRRLRPLLGKRRSGRFAVSRHSFGEELAASGLRVEAMRALARFVGEQTLVLCRRRN